MTKETYSKPIVEIEKFKTYDVITTSIDGGEGQPDDENATYDFFVK